MSMYVMVTGDTVHKCVYSECACCGQTGDTVHKCVYSECACCGQTGDTVYNVCTASVHVVVRLVTLCTMCVLRVCMLWSDW